MFGMAHFKLRDYQKELSYKAVEILYRYNIVYLSMEVRCGKTLTSLETARKMGSKNVLFITKKKAISSIQSDYKSFEYDKFFNITIINNESLHKISDDFDLLISDEHHRNGAFPKPNKVTKLIKERYSKLPMIFLSGTPHPESYSQIYHQFWLSDYSPFFKNTNFYKWANEFVNIKKKKLGYAIVNDYSDCYYNKLKPIIDKYFISFTQKEAGFETNVKENILKIPISDKIKTASYMLRKNKVIITKDGYNIIADTGAKMKQKLHQIYSGTIITDEKETIIFDTSKADFIKKRFEGNKIALFYKFKAELTALKQVYGDNLTTELDEFNNSYKNIALQIVSGREGISLKSADYLVYYNIDFSAVSYFQSKDRLTTKERKSNNVYWIFTDGGIEEKIYRTVIGKKDYTLSVFKKDFL